MGEPRLYRDIESHLTTPQPRVVLPLHTPEGRPAAQVDPLIGELYAEQVERWELTAEFLSVDSSVAHLAARALGLRFVGRSPLLLIWAANAGLRLAAMRIAPLLSDEDAALFARDVHWLELHREELAHAFDHEQSAEDHAERWRQRFAQAGEPAIEVAERSGVWLQPVHVARGSPAQALHEVLRVMVGQEPERAVAWVWSRTHILLRILRQVGVLLERVGPERVLTERIAWLRRWLDFTVTSVPLRQDDVDQVLATKQIIYHDLLGLAGTELDPYVQMGRAVQRVDLEDTDQRRTRRGPPRFRRRAWVVLDRRIIDDVLGRLRAQVQRVCDCEVREDTTTAAQVALKNSLKLAVVNYLTEHDRADDAAELDGMDYDLWRAPYQTSDPDAPWIAVWMESE